MGKLRKALAGAINSRIASLRNGRCRRKDYDQIWASIYVAQEFLKNFPYANEERVRAWCVEHRSHVSRIVPGNQPGVLAKLLMDELAPLTR